MPLTQSSLQRGIAIFAKLNNTGYFYTDTSIRRTPGIGPCHVTVSKLIVDCLGICKHQFFKFVFCNPSQSYSILTILVPFWFNITSLMFFYLSKLLFSGFLQFERNFVHRKNDFYPTWQLFMCNCVIISTWDYQWVCIQSYCMPCYCNDGGIYVHCSIWVQDSTVSHFAVTRRESSLKCLTNLQLDVAVSQGLKMSCLPVWTTKLFWVIKWGGRSELPTSRTFLGGFWGI